jgi:methionyl aminopeptidase
MGMIKTDQQINIMRENGKILGNILLKLKTMIKPGLDAWELELEFIDLCKKNNVNPSCKGYRPYYLPPFPTGLCVSVNDQCVHCYPKKGQILNEGDLITIDTVIDAKGLYVDSSFATTVGNASEIKQRLVKTSEEALNKALKEAKANKRIGDIANAIQTTAYKNKLNVLEDYAGHGIGTDMHEDPEVPCTGNPNTGLKLREGMVICIESLICTGDSDVRYQNSWETVMRDGGYFGQFEHTVLIKNGENEILTLPN